ncbi:MAG: glutamine-synthetase adenylyltransferase, partial [Pseudomonadota bacterium]
MSFDSQMTRCPRPFDGDLGTEAVARMPDLTAPVAELIRGAAGSSPYLNGLIARETTWLSQALDDPDAAVTAEFARIEALPLDEVRDGLRITKRRLALLTALADLAGVWSLEQVTGHLTQLADRSVDVVVKTEIATLIQRGKLPGQSPEDVASAGGLVVLAMGKMGAGELNYSS